MSLVLNYDDFSRMLLSAVEEIRANHELLTRLDSVGGDGDHGTTMVRAMGLLEKTLQQASGPDVGPVLKSIGWAIMGVDGGAIGPLLGLFFAGMASAAPKGDVDTRALAAMFAAGLANMQKQTKAQPGDKTLMDALVPAVAAAQAASAADADVNMVLNAAAVAAEEGAESTKEMMAKFGRAKNIKEQSIGSPDPGATSIALIMKAFTKGVTLDA
jgi:dihydroxyacetone kinase-like protein